jgi:hypothetical protein
VAPGEAKRLRIIVVAGREAVLGRDSGVDFTVRPLPEEADTSLIMKLSGKHARLRLDAGRATIEDLSRNGTRVDGRPLRPSEPTPLGDGATIDLAGALELKVRLLVREGRLDGALLLRVRNAPNHSYLLLAGDAPLAGVLHLVTGSPWGFADLPVLRGTGWLSVRAGERGAAQGVRWAASAVRPEVFKQAEVPEIETR